MKKIFTALLFFCLPAAAQQPAIMMTEQAQHRIIIVEPYTNKTIWEWKADSAHAKWFTNPSDAKVVYNGEYMITCASGGGVAMVRLKDKRTMLSVYAGGNTHSVELLPDGNLVSASSSGNYLTLFKVDTMRGTAAVQQVPIPSGHNVVWDRERKVLLSAGMHHLYTYRYNFNCRRPALQLIDSIPIPGEEGHDLFPVYDRDSLWLTTVTHFSRIDAATRQIDTLHTKIVKNIKSVSSGPPGYPTIITIPKEKWWTDEILDLEGNSVYKQEGLRIYKARWVLFNEFSYDGRGIRLCK